MRKQSSYKKQTYFDHPVLEFFAKTSVAGIWGIYMVAMGILLYVCISQFFLTSLPISIALFVAGVLIWTLFEYALHRYIFHIVTEHPIGKTILHAAHGYHHDFPTDKDHLFMPPLLGLTILAILLGIFYLVMGGLTFAFSSGILMGYLLYSTMHYNIHRYYSPKNRYLTTMWRHHHLPHYRFPDKAVGVSTLLWDHVFGSMPPKSERKKA